LVERTSDEVTLGSDPLPDVVFSEVLAQAEAAVNGGDVLTHMEEPGRLYLPPGAPPERIEGMTEHLAALAVPIEFRPAEADATLDGLARALSHLPVAPPIPTSGGAVVVVVGARREVRVAARQLLGHLALEPSDLIEADPTDLCRQRVVRRRASNKVTLLSVEASLRAHLLPQVATWIEKVKPDYVLGAVPATAKRADIVHWASQLGPLDALALSRLADTASPGELMGTLPIYLLDGREASTLTWVLRLLSPDLGSGR